MDKHILEKWLADSQGLHKHRRWLNQLIDQKEYRSTAEVEYALRKTRGWISSSIDSYWNIMSIQKLWPKLANENGQKELLTRAKFSALRGSNESVYRDRMTNKYY